MSNANVLVQYYKTDSRWFQQNAVMVPFCLEDFGLSKYT